MNPEAKRPMFFVVGAPRCGTTALCRALARHPEICMSKPREPHFFSRENIGKDDQETLATYFKLFFSHLSPEHKIMGEGSVSYLYVPESIRRTQHFFPGSKYIVCVRNPIEMVYSYHARLISHMDEDIEDFRTAWDMQAERAKGKRVPVRCRDPLVLQYATIGSLGQHIERLFDMVGEENCKIVLFDDVVRDSAAAFRDVIEFLGLEDAKDISIEQRNANKELRHSWLYGMIVRPPRPVQQMIAVATGSHHKVPDFLRPMRRKVKQMTRVPAQRQTMDDETRTLLRQAFSEDISRLSRVLGKNLDHWQ